MRTPLVLGLILASAPAYAGHDEADRMHDFSGLDRWTGESGGFVDAGYVFMGKSNNGLDFGDFKILRFDVGGEYVAPMGVGAYLTAPMTFVSTPDVTFPVIGTIKGDSEFSIGNIELGGLYYLKAAPLDVLFRAGLALPTADDDGPGGFMGWSAITRLGDLVDVWPNATWLRLSASPMARTGKLFLRGDFGIDAAISNDNNYSKVDPVIRLGAGGGVDLGEGEITAELITMWVHDPGNTNDSTVNWSELTLGARMTSGAAHPGISLHLPLGVDQPYDATKLAIVASVVVHGE